MPWPRQLDPSICESQDLAPSRQTSWQNLVPVLDANQITIKGKNVNDSMLSLVDEDGQFADRRRLNISRELRSKTCCLEEHPPTCLEHEVHQTARPDIRRVPESAVGCSPQEEVNLQKRQIDRDELDMTWRASHKPP
ncbi:hypothetical protein R1flu_005207 [Riccia fluitans]|uniref:Uncharacterized protein n=1 Tax=Riccia fluitans TaxID=41844 RepID=A0ABD1YT45_9MARC